MKQIITWMDLQGRYRVTSPAYDHLSQARGFTEDDAINWVWSNIVAVGKYGITFDHSFHLVEDAVQRTKIVALADLRYRYQVGGDIDSPPGAWEMDDDGTPKVNLAKAALIHRDYIQQAVDKLSPDRRAALGTLARDYDLSGIATPLELRARWPAELRG